MAKNLTNKLKNIGKGLVVAGALSAPASYNTCYAQEQQPYQNQPKVEAVEELSTMDVLKNIGMGFGILTGACVAIGGAMIAYENSVDNKVNGALRDERIRQRHKEWDRRAQIEARRCYRNSIGRHTF